MQEKEAGHLLIIGGAEDKSGDCKILQRFIEIAGGRKARIAIITTATEYPREVGEEYQDLFAGMGAEHSFVLTVSSRQAANDRQQASQIDRSTGIFFTGGDQLRLTSILGGSTVEAAIRRAFTSGTIIAGTSAGASVMSNTMIVGGDSSDTAKKSNLTMAHGLGLLNEVVIDQHFAQRGRINRLLSAVAQNPHVLGVGIDEDTAILVGANRQCEVIGTQTITVVDGKSIQQSNVSDSQYTDPLAITQVTLHILPAGFGFDLARRLPYAMTADS